MTHQQQGNAPAPAGPVDFIVWEEAGGPPLPDASYYAVLASVEVAPAREFQGKQLDPGFRWSWEVANGPHKGRKCGRITGQRPNDKNKCGDFVRGLIGHSPKAGERFSLRDHIGRTSLVVVKDGKVESVSAPPV